MRYRHPVTGNYTTATFQSYTSSIIIVTGVFAVLIMLSFNPIIVRLKREQHFPQEEKNQPFNPIIVRLIFDTTLHNFFDNVTFQSYTSSIKMTVFG